MREKNKLLDETTWRIIREAKGIAGWVAVSAVPARIPGRFPGWILHKLPSGC